MRLALLFVVVATGACNQILGVGELHGAAGVDASADGPVDASSPDGAPDAPPLLPSDAKHLLLSELCLAPTPEEFIEIVNPTDTIVPLAQYYLADTGSYFVLPGGAPTSPTVAFGDFIARFPDGSTLGPHGVAIVAMGTAANFQTASGVAPTYSIADGTMDVVTVAAPASLTDVGEMVALFYWDGATDNVTDVDIMVAGMPTTANSLVDKSGMGVDGPDPDTTATPYRADADSIPSQAMDPGVGASTKRALSDAGHETANGSGNGVDGADETSEATNVTWDSTTFTAPTPGTVPDSLFQ